MDEYAETLRTHPLIAQVGAWVFFVESLMTRGGKKKKERARKGVAKKRGRRVGRWGQGDQGEGKRVPEEREVKPRTFTVNQVSI